MLKNLDNNTVVMELGAASGSLEAMLAFAERQTDRIFKATGIIHPMFHAETDDKTFIFTVTLNNKDAACKAMAKHFARLGVKRFIFVDEAWTLSMAESEATPEVINKIMREGLKKNPARKEVVMLHAQDQATVKTVNFDIVRPDGKPPYLANRESVDSPGVSRWDLLLSHLRGRPQ
jgi:hypothetical protein